MAGAPQQMSMEECLAPFSDRQHKQRGRTAIKQPTSIDIIHNAHLKKPTMWSKCMVLSKPHMCCGCLDLDRSYLYLRENGIEMNQAYAPCCGLCGCASQDSVTVWFYDRNPFVGSYCCGGKPNFEVIEIGCVMCCVKLQCCEYAVLAPPNKAFPCCCFGNKSKLSPWCCGGNCCNCCGAIAGQPVNYSFVYPQPKDPHTFVQKAKAVQKSGSSGGAGGLIAEVMGNES